MNQLWIFSFLTGTELASVHIGGSGMRLDRMANVA
jgi:hypothetical protein